MTDVNGNVPQKVVLFAPINAAGHMQSSLAIADKLRADYNYKCVFVISGPPHTNIIEDHGHELVVCQDVMPMWDYEIESGDSDYENDEHALDELKKRQGKKKRMFEGSARWPQFIGRNKRLFRVEAKKSVYGVAKLIDHFIPWMIENNRPVDQIIQRLEPDLIVADTVIPNPSILREQHRRPWVRVFTPNPLGVLRPKPPNQVTPPRYQGHKLYSKQEREQLRTHDRERYEAMLAEWHAAFKQLTNLLKGTTDKIAKYYHENGYTQVDNEYDKLLINSPYLNIYMYPEALDYDQDDDLFEYPSRWLRCDSLVRNTDGQKEQIEREFWAKQIDERKDKFKSIVYFSLGSIASNALDLIKRYVNYLNEDDGNTLYIISKGVNGDQIELNPRNMIGGNYLPQTFLLQLSDLAIIHGGNNSLTESLYYGKPVIVLPAFGDQPDNAQRVEDLKLGKRLDLYQCTQDQLLGAIKETLADRNLADKMRAIGERMRSRDELGKVTSLLRELVEKGSGGSVTIGQHMDVGTN